MNYINHLSIKYLKNVLLQLKVTTNNQTLFLEFLPGSKRTEKPNPAKLTNKYFNDFAKNYNEDFLDCKFYQSVMSLQKTFELSEEEISMLGALIVLEYKPGIKLLLREISKGNRFDESIVDYCSILLKKDRYEISRFINLSSKLMRAGVFNKDTFREIKISRKISEFLNNYTGKSYLEVFLEKDTSINSMSLDTFEYKKELSLIAEILKNKRNAKIFISGSAGLGKTSSVRFLRDLTGLELFFIPQASDSGAESVQFRRSALIALNSTEISDAIYVTDEAEIILNQNNLSLNSESCNKSWINRYLESNDLRQVFIVNNDNLISSSTLRRMDYVLKFRDLNQKGRQQVMLQIVSEKNINLSDDDTSIMNMISKIDVSPADLELALQSAMAIAIDRSEIFRYWHQIVQSKSSVYNRSFLNNQISLI